MPSIVAAGEFRAKYIDGAPGSWVLEGLAAGQPRIVIAGHVGVRLPATLHEIDLRPAGGPAGSGRWRLACREGEFEFEARGVERLDPLPQLFDPLLRGFALRARERAWAGVLLKLLRLPGGAWLLRTWHASRR